MSQLTKTEIRKIKIYCTLSHITKASLLSAVFTMILGGFFLMMDQGVLDAQKFYGFGMTVTVILFIVLMMLTIIARIISNGVLYSSRWKDIEAKLEQKYIEDGDLIVLEDGRKKITWNSTFIQQRGRMGVHQRIHAVAKEFSVDLLLEKVSKMLILIVPFLIVTIVFIPEFKDSIKWKKEQIAVVSEANSKLEEEFSKIGYTGYGDDVSRTGMEYYTFSAYPNDYEDGSYCTIDLNKNGQIRSISYSADILVGQSLEDSYKRINQLVFKQNEVIRKSGVEAENQELLEQNQVSRALIRQFEDSRGKTNEYTEISVNEILNTLYYGIEYATEESPGVMMFSVSIQEDYE